MVRLSKREKNLGVALLTRRMFLIKHISPSGLIQLFCDRMSCLKLSTRLEILQKHAKDGG